MPSPTKLRALAERWAVAKAAERSNAQSFIIELCDALDVERPRPAGSGYEFELPIKLTARDGTETQGFVDCYKERHFVLEAKDFEEKRSNDILLRKAYGQARTYAAHDPSGVAPPYLLVLDVGKTLLVWDRWAGTFGGFAAAKRVDLTRLHERPDDVALLKDIWANPGASDPRTMSQAVTKDIAAHLAELAASLEHLGFEQERVARFLMRAVFTMFAEDVGLLPDEPFRRLLHEVALPEPAEFPAAAEDLWRAMDEGRRFGFRKLLRFNGHFFKDAEALPLSRDDLAILLEAAKADWSKVEPTIFGTLLTRALDPVERHRLGAEYTPPEFIERLIRPTIEEPVRERWTAVQAEVLQLRESNKAKDREKAEKRLLEFHEWLRSLKVLDPACGSGNFLYLAMHALKRVEVEVLHELAEVRGGALELRMQEVDPSQFYGIEVKPWAREIAELTLWIGFHQFWRQHHGNVQPEEPLLRDTGTLECRDAVLTWDAAEVDPSRDRPDPTPCLRHPATGEMVPDPAARIPVLRYDGAQAANWPDADFIVGNPPYLGKTKQREALGDGYVEALRAAYAELPDTADYVMYWWAKAADAVRRGRTIRAGLITTNTITQREQRRVVAEALNRGLTIVWAVADHPWQVTTEAAAVRVAMTVLQRPPAQSRLAFVSDDGVVTRELTVSRLNTDLTAHADVGTAATIPLLANAGVAYCGTIPGSAGFTLAPEEAAQVLRGDAANRRVVRPYINGRDLTGRARGVYIIDFALMSEDQAREYAVPFDIVHSRVRPHREANPRAARARNWWRFSEPAGKLREAMKDLDRFIATPDTSKHRFFTFVDASVLPDYQVVMIGSSDPFTLGVLSSKIHEVWAIAVGGRMGVGNDPRYKKSSCFDPYPFPHATGTLRTRIADVATRLDTLRGHAIRTFPHVTMTAIYNVLQKLQHGESLEVKERAVFRDAACETLRELHRELDEVVAQAYGWAWPEPDALILERLVALHDERAELERAGKVWWLRPDYQIPRFGQRVDAADLGIERPDTKGSTSAAVRTPWPEDAVGQITALRQLVAGSPVTTEEAASQFSGAPKTLVARHLETLSILGEIRSIAGGRYAAASAVA